MKSSFLFIVLALHIFLVAVYSEPAKLVLLQDEKEAVCLDGSPPGYYFRQG